METEQMEAMSRTPAPTPPPAKPQEVDIHDLAPRIAEWMTPGKWKVAKQKKRPANMSQANDYPILEGPDELKIALHVEWRDKTRISVSGVYPTEVDTRGRMQHYGNDAKKYDESWPSISVSGMRTAEAIARDIQNRLLPDVENLLARAKQRRTAHREYLDREDAHTTAFDKMTPGIVKMVPSSSSRGPSFDIKTSKDYSGPHGTANIDSDGDVTLELRNIPPKIAAQMLWVLNNCLSRKSMRKKS